MNTAVKIRSADQLSVDDYLAFIATRPSEERWQLIDGVAMMLPPPTLRHQTVAGNLAFELKFHFRSANLDFNALQEIGLIVPDVDKFRPEADVAVVDSSLELDTSWADRFHLVAEVLSDSNTDEEIELKRQRYLQHPDNLYCLVISQTEVKVEIWARANGWQRVELTRLDDMISLPEFGFELPLVALYRDTPLGRTG